MSTANIEKTFWNEYYEKALQGEGQEAEQGLWWEIADRDLCETVAELFPKTAPIDILEAGCGSGASSFMLSEYVPIQTLSLLDITPNAIAFAKKKYKEGSYPSIERAAFYEGNIFDLHEHTNKYDLVWNMGLIEHYGQEDILKIATQMYNAVKQNGYLVIGIPNRRSPAVLKAAFLGSSFGKRFFNWVPGYKNATEILYGKNTLISLLKQIRSDLEISIQYAGSPLLVGTPKKLVQLVDTITTKSPFSFLQFFIIQKK